jgi:hypothetical protein
METPFLEDRAVYPGQAATQMAPVGLYANGRPQNAIGGRALVA